MSAVLPVAPPAPARSADDELAASLRGFGPIGILAISIILLSGNVVLDNLFVLPIGAILVVAWAWRSRTPWREIGYVRPRRWILTIASGAAFGVGLKMLMKAIVMPLLGADSINHAYHFLAGNRALLPTAIWGVTIAGLAEETVFRGYMFERFTRLLGRGAWARILMIAVTSTWFGLSHYASQGLAGVEQATVVGLVFGTTFAVTGRLLPLMCAHAAFNLTALAMIYWKLESDVAHLVFR